MGYSRTGWAAGVIAPWCLGMAIVVSISADAGQEPAYGASFAPVPLHPASHPALLIPAGPAAHPGPANDFAALSGEARKILQESSLSIGSGEDFRRLPDEIEPRAVMKRNAQLFPTVDRTHRGDPLVGLRPSFDSHLQQSHGAAKLRAEDLDDESTAAENPATFEPLPDSDSPATAHSSAGASPGQNGSLVTMRPSVINERLLQGATPATRRAIALESATPAPLDSRPVEVVALPVEPQLSVPIGGEAPAAGAQTRSSAFLAQDQAARESHCLSEAIYFEARGESSEGQAAVAQVVLNRVASGLYPPTICGVVYQNRKRWHGCQFSFACEGKSLRITDPGAWARAERIAAEVTNGKTYVSDVAGSTHYHANYVRPRWARRLEKTDVIGHHIFYKLRPGQS